LQFNGAGTRTDTNSIILLSDDTITDKLYRTSLSQTCLTTFLGYTPQEDGRTPTDMSVVTLARMDVWIVSVVWAVGHHVTGKGKPVQDKYTAAYNRFIGEATRQLLQTLYTFAHITAPETTINVPVRAPWLRARSGREGSPLPTDIVTAPSNESYLRVNPRWILQRISKHVGVMQDAFIATSDGATPMFTVHDFLLRGILVGRANVGGTTQGHPHSTPIRPQTPAQPPHHTGGQYVIPDTQERLMERPDAGVIIPETQEQDISGLGGDIVIPDTQDQVDG